MPLIWLPAQRAERALIISNSFLLRGSLYFSLKCLKQDIKYYIRDTEFRLACGVYSLKKVSSKGGTTIAALDAMKDLVDAVKKVWLFYISN